LTSNIITVASVGAFYFWVGYVVCSWDGNPSETIWACTKGAIRTLESWIFRSQTFILTGVTCTFIVLPTGTLSVTSIWAVSISTWKHNKTKKAKSNESKTLNSDHFILFLSSLNSQRERARMKRGRVGRGDQS
jgi:hypothetical protein